MIVPSKVITLKDNKELELRSLKVEEAKTLIDCMLIVFDESARNMNSTKARFEKMTIEEEEKMLATLASSEKEFMLGAFDQGELVGTLGIHHATRGEFTLHSAMLGMCLKKSHHNLGLGQALISYALVMAKQNGLHRLSLSVRTFNKPGISLYEKMSFKRLCLLKDAAFIEGQYYDEYLYEQILL